MMPNPYPSPSCAAAAPALTPIAVVIEDAQLRAAMPRSVRPAVHLGESAPGLASQQVVWPGRLAANGRVRRLPHAFVVRLTVWPTNADQPTSPTTRRRLDRRSTRGTLRMTTRRRSDLRCGHRPHTTRPASQVHLSPVHP